MLESKKPVRFNLEITRVYILGTALYRTVEFVYAYGSVQTLKELKKYFEQTKNN